MHRASVSSALAVLAVSAAGHAQTAPPVPRANHASTSPPVIEALALGASLVPFTVEGIRPGQILTIAPLHGPYRDACVLPCTLYLHPGPFTLEARDRGGPERWSAHVVVPWDGGSARLYPTNNAMILGGTLLVLAGIAGFLGSAALLGTTALNYGGSDRSMREGLGTVGFVGSPGMVFTGVMLLVLGPGGATLHAGPPEPPRSRVPSAATAPPRREPTEPNVHLGVAPDLRGGGSLVAALRF